MEILKDIIIIFALSIFVNYIFTKIKIPTIIGYLLTGIIAGPYLFGLIKQQHEIELMAEIGVVLLMFTIGLEFSLTHLIKIRKIVFAGGFMQMIATAIVTMLIARIYDLNWAGALFIGFLTALSSTAIVLKLLQERSELTSNYGRTVLGILIFQDIILIPLLLFTPMLGGENQMQDGDIFILLIKAVFIVGFVFIANRWLMPKLLHIIALTKNQELFMMSILLIGLSVAFFTHQLGMSLAFGAFLAGLMISESEYSHSAFGHLIPFKDTFTSFFFVSIGLLLDLNFVVDNLLLVVATTILVIFIKAIIAGGTSFVLGHTFRGTIMVGIALSQVGEFSFILAKLGLDYEIIPQFYYQLFLAVAVISMSVSPVLIQLSPAAARLLLKLPIPKSVVDGIFPLKEIDIPELKNHLVFIGKDSRALNLSAMAKYLNLPYISIVFDPEIVQQRQLKGDTIIYGDAQNLPILEKAHVNTAEIIVLSVGDLIVAMSIVEKIRQLNKHAYILVRTKSVENIEDIYRLGANEVIPEEFETAIDLFERVLRQKLIPQRKINSTIGKIRDDHYGFFRKEDLNADSSVFNELPNVEIRAFRLDEDSYLINKNLKEVRFRFTFKVTLVAILRNEDLIEHPEPDDILKSGDILYVMGKPEQIANAVEMLAKKEDQ